MSALPQPQRPAPDYARYERMKNDYVAEALKLPYVTPGAYDIAIRQIAKECGV